jgi:hypothetical protein
LNKPGVKWVWNFDKRLIGPIYMIIGILLCVSNLPNTPLRFIRNLFISVIRGQIVYMVVAFLIAFVAVWILFLKDLLLGKEPISKELKLSLIVYKLFSAMFIDLILVVLFIWLGMNINDNENVIFGIAGSYILASGLFKLGDFEEKFLNGEFGKGIFSDKRFL